MPKPYDGLPWFWSDQGPDKLQIAGLTTGYDRVVVRGDRAQGAFSAFCYKAGQLLGIESVNRAGDHMFGRRLLAANRSITPEQAADMGFDLKARAGFSDLASTSTSARRHRRRGAHPLHADRSRGIGVIQRVADRFSLAAVVRPPRRQSSRRRRWCRPP